MPTSSCSIWNAWLDASLDDLQRRSLFRTLRPTYPGRSAVEVQVHESDLNAWLADGFSSGLSNNIDSHRTKTVKLFSLNDYLGLSTHPRVRQASAQAALRCGNGPRSSALVGGYTHDHRNLEIALAQLKQTSDALLFPTGFAANMAVLTALAGPDVDIFSDELNHASIVDGARLAKRNGATLHIYRHNDMKHLETLLQMQREGRRRRIVITDSLFSMDGDFANLHELARLRSCYGFLLAVDEAHATLVCGNKGGGAVEDVGVEGSVDLHIGTLSKAFGCQGGFVACSKQWKDFLVNKGRAQVFSTALPVPTVAAALAALHVAQDEPWRRRHVMKLAHRFGNKLGISASSPIIPLILGGEDVTMQASRELLRLGYHVPGIRPPTVPGGTSRLRVSLSAAHTTEDIDLLVESIRGVVNVGAERGPARGIGSRL